MERMSVAQTISTKSDQFKNIRIQLRCWDDVVRPREVFGIDVARALRQISEQDKNLDYRAPKERFSRSNRRQNIRPQQFFNPHQFEKYFGLLPPLPGCLGFFFRSQDRFAQRAPAAFRAIAALRFALKLLARAFPPFNPPRRPSATAAGFFVPFPFPIVFCANVPAAIWLTSLSMRHYA